MSDDRPRVKFLTAIVADDIRREANNKEFYIGVYTAKMIFSEILPNQGMLIAISALIECDKTGDIPISFEVKGPNNQDPFLKWETSP